jgi:uncharacterized membrane protein
MMFLRDLSPGPRLLICVAVGVAVFLSAPVSFGPAIRSALGWIAAAGCFLGLTAFAVGGAPPERLRALAREQDARRWVILGLVILAAMVSLIAVTVLLHKQDGEGLIERVLRIALVAGVVIESWLLTHTVFALHYAHGYYGDGPVPAEDRGGLQFPGDSSHPDFWDFLYFSLVIGMTCQVSDVQINGVHMRRLATMHGVLSFFFNTGILALTINLLVAAL